MSSQPRLSDTELPGQPGGAGPGESWLNRNVVGFGITSLLADLCYETATAVLPAFLKVLGAPAVALGFMEGAADAVSSFVKMAAGWYSDRLPRRKPIAVLGYAITAASIGLMAFASLWPVVVLLRVLAWVGKGARGPARNAMLTASVPPQHKGKAFGFHRAGDTIGAILGPLVAAALIGWFGAAATQSLAPLQSVLLATLVPGLGSVLVIGLLVREPARIRSAPRRLRESLSSLPGEYRRWLVGVGAFGAGDFSHTLLILAAIELLAPSRGFIVAAQWGATLFAIRNIAAAIAAYPVGSLSDRWGRLGLLIGTYLLGAAVIVAFGVTMLLGWSHLVLLGVLFIGAGVVNAAQEALEAAAASDLVPDDSLHGTAFGVLGAVNGIGDFISSTVVGLLWMIAPVWGFGYAAVMMLLGTGLLFRCRGSR